jgi:ATP-dependent RNA helicase SUPV3L1/SUV3
MTSSLPIPRHADRLPPHIGAEQVARIRHALHHLPQVVKPADYLADTHADFETHLDKLGLVLLQKPVAGQRPSRWIDPDGAAGIDAIGSGEHARRGWCAPPRSSCGCRAAPASGRA